MNHFLHWLQRFVGEFMCHQCIKCGCSYPEDSKEILQGCSCGGKAFYFVRDPNLTDYTKTSFEVVDFEHRDLDETRLEGPMGNIESIDNNVSSNCTLIDVDELLHKKEIIFSPEDGKYALNVEALLSGERPKL